MLWLFQLSPHSGGPASRVSGSWMSRRKLSLSMSWRGGVGQRAGARLGGAGCGARPRGRRGRGARLLGLRDHPW